MDLFRVAVVQAGSVPFDRERSTMKALDLTGQAIRSGARLIVFPEAFISGYPKGIDFGARVGMRSSEGRSGSAPILRVPLWYLDLRWTN
jgi:nitrilase